MQALTPVPRSAQLASRARWAPPPQRRPTFGRLPVRPQQGAPLTKPQKEVEALSENLGPQQSGSGTDCSTGAQDKVA